LLASLCGIRGSAPFTFQNPERDFEWYRSSKGNQRAFQKQLYNTFEKSDLI